jgi:hypothetical protein
MASEEERLVVKFRADKIKNEGKTKAAGRPIFDDIELVEIRTAGDRNTVKVFPAHSMHRWVMNEDGEQEVQTYAQRWNQQYRRFKENRQQVQDGTPLSELPFLTEAKRAELRALSIHTAETLAALDGQNLKTLGPGGRELKNQAQAYLDAASGSANVTQMAAQIAELQSQLAALQNTPSHLLPEATAPEDAADQPDEPSDDFENSSDDELKEYIASITGSKPRGNPSHETLVRMAREAAEQEAA